MTRYDIILCSTLLSVLTIRTFCVGIRTYCSTWWNTWPLANCGECKHWNPVRLLLEASASQFLLIATPRFMVGESGSRFAFILSSWSREDVGFFPSGLIVPLFYSSSICGVNVPGYGILITFFSSCWDQNHFAGLLCCGGQSWATQKFCHPYELISKWEFISLTVLAADGRLSGYLPFASCTQLENLRLCVSNELKCYITGLVLVLWFSAKSLFFHFILIFFYLFLPSLS